ncbi:MAG: alpha-amylase family glycosyl hydrolase [Bacteroidota bacterium]|jgi:glycosidase
MKKSLFAALLIALMASCGVTKNQDYTSVANQVGYSETKVIRHPEWSKNATIYEVNVRQHTAAGTFSALEKDLPRIDSLGIDILWLMPIHPIGDLNRKGSLGSYYSVKNYVGVNPEFGSLADFKHLVATAHQLGMKVIIDWVGNHTAWDHPWMNQHPDWYTRDANGNVIPPVADWSDVADLNFDNQEMRKEMIRSLEFWVKECDIDGYRCDVAMMVPTDFWDDARAALDAIKPVFMLAEAEQKDHHLKAFDMSYGWELLHIMNGIAKGEKNLDEIELYMQRQANDYPKSAYKMCFTTNHDENTWNGTGGERYGNKRKLFDVLAFTLQGMPLVYSSQEGGEVDEKGNPKRLKFFDKDTVNVNGYIHSEFYKKLLQVHHENPALWNGEFGGTFQRLKTTNEGVFAYVRTNGERQVVVLLNFTEQAQTFNFIDETPSGDFRSIFNSETFSIYAKNQRALGPLGYQVFSK